MPDRVDLDQVAIVLHRPRYPENIGAAARAMRNMGLCRLIVVEPENPDLTRILKMATHVAADIIETMAVAEELKKVLASFGYVVGTTARLGRQRRPAVLTPRQLAETLIPLSRENDVAIVFGPEDRGLANEDLRYCHALLNIPTAAFSSLNLAQAVMVVCYELSKAGAKAPPERIPRLASRRELDGMYEQLKDILVRISFVNPENPDYWMNNLRRFFTRLQLRAREISIIRGICRQIDWYGKKNYEDGRRNRKKDESQSVNKKG